MYPSVLSTGLIHRVLKLRRWLLRWLNPARVPWPRNNETLGATASLALDITLTKYLVRSALPGLLERLISLYLKDIHFTHIPLKSYRMLRLNVFYQELLSVLGNVVTGDMYA